MHVSFLQHGLTALHKASERNNVVIVQHIITAGCNQTIDAQTTVCMCAVCMHGGPRGKHRGSFLPKKHSLFPPLIISYELYIAVYREKPSSLQKSHELVTHTYVHF